MATLLVSTARVTLVLSVVGLAVAGCGRKGELDRPSTPVEQQNIRKDTKANDKKAPPAPERPFLLDPLL